MKEVKKKWGKELWLVNTDKYCSKLLYLNRGAVSSLHSHPKKMETFYCLSGSVMLTIMGKREIMDGHTFPVTIEPGQVHQFEGKEDSVLLEVSTTHSEDDVERIYESRG